MCTTVQTLCTVRVNNIQSEQAFPTEAALKAKEKRVKIKEEQGISCHQQQKITKSTKTVQEHYDDCGSDISPLLKYENDQLLHQT